MSQCTKPYPVSNLDDSGDFTPPEVMSKTTSTGNKNTSFSNANDIDGSLIPSTKINEQINGNSPSKDKNLATISEVNKSEVTNNGKNRALSIQRDVLCDEIYMEKEKSGQNHLQTSELKESSFSIDVESEPNSEDMDWRHEAISGSTVIEQKKSNKNRRHISDMKTEALAIIVHDSKDNMVKVVVDTRGELSAMSSVTENALSSKGSPKLPIDERTKTTDDLISSGPSPKVRNSPRDSELQSINKQIGEAAARNREKTTVIQELIAENLRYKIRNRVRGGKRYPKRSYEDFSKSSMSQVWNIELSSVGNSASDPLNSPNSVDVTSYKSWPGVTKSRANSADINQQVLDQPSTFSSGDELQSDASVQEVKAENMRSQTRKHARSNKVKSPIIRYKRRSYPSAKGSKTKIPLRNMSLRSQVIITNMRRARSPPSEPNSVDKPFNESSSDAVNINESRADISKQVFDEPLTFSRSLSKQKTDASPKAASVEEQSSANSGQWEYSAVMII